MSTKDTNPKDALSADRAPLDLIPATALVEMSLAMAEGAFKYGAGNWAKAGVRARVYIAAQDRHQKRYASGMTRDENGVHELARVMACCAIVIDAEARGILTDDRLPAFEGFEDLLTRTGETVRRLREKFSSEKAPDQPPRGVSVPAVEPTTDLKKLADALNAKFPSTANGKLNAILELRKRVNEGSVRVKPPQKSLFTVVTVGNLPRGTKLRVVKAPDNLAPEFVPACPAVGTVITLEQPDECGFYMPDGRYTELGSSGWRFELVQDEPKQLELPFTGKQLAIKDLTEADVGKRFRVVATPRGDERLLGRLYALESVVHASTYSEAYFEDLGCLLFEEWRFEHVQD